MKEKEFIMKKILALGLASILSLSLLTGCSDNNEVVEDTIDDVVVEEQLEEQEVERSTVNVVALKGPTAMGLIEFMNDADSGEEFAHDYNFSLTAATDEVTASLVKGDVDIAAIPANLASVLYNNTDGGIQVIAINTLGVLYVLENGDSITEISDLKGQTIVASGKGGTPEMSLRYILSENGIDPDTDVTIEWKSEQAECLAYLTSTEGAIAMMPQPFVTNATLANENINIQLDLTAEWDKTQENSENPSSLITGVMVARTDFINENEEALNDFLTNYENSVNFVNTNVDEAAQIIGEYGITPYETAVLAIPACNIVYIDSTPMKSALSGYLEVLFNQNATSVGGELPQDNFYYAK